MTQSPSEAPAAPKIMRGLKDIYFDRSAVTYIDGKAGDLR